MPSYEELVDSVIEENRNVLKRVNEKEINQLVNEIVNAKTIQVYAVGRMRLAALGFAMRLMHMGLDVHMVFDVTCPRIGKGDLLLVNAGVTTMSLGIMNLAKKAGARVGVVTAYPDNENGRAADFTVKLPGQIFDIADEEKSIQPMATLMEQSLLLFEDIVVMLLMERLNITSKQMEERHTNLEGVSMEFA
jgi:6-phospho-3-hexuloisomerase